jgi:hypothetical protein
MIDFAQDGRPVGSVDLSPEVVADERGVPACLLPTAGGLNLELDLLAGRVTSAPDLVLKVFEHRLAGHPGRLQFVLSSSHQALSDLPVLDGDLGTLDLRSDVASWVGELLRTVGTLAEQPTSSPKDVTRTLEDVGCNLFQKLLPPALQDLCWTFRQRGVKTLMILSDEPHIPWELVKPFRTDPATGAIVSEDSFWGESFAITHWLRGRPPVSRLSVQRVMTLAPASRKRGTAPRPSPLTSSADEETRNELTRDMVVTAPFSSTGLSAYATLAEKSPSVPRAHAGTSNLGSAEEELDLLCVWETLGARVQRLPAKRNALRQAIEQGEFDLLHLVSHGTFGGTLTSDGSAVLLDDGIFTAAELSPRMAGPMRKCAPLIFFNTCHSGRVGFSLTSLGAWGARFVHLGCGGFVGALWPVTDQAAMAFARAFYELLTHQCPIGEAVRLARQQVHEQFPNDPTWLAYRCFADPMARIDLPATS